MGRLLLVRHGETPWNLDGRLQGSTDVDLSEKGREQARLVGRRLSTTAIDLAYSSNQSRARETAEIILEGRDVEGRDVPLHAIPELRERSHGVFEGLTAKERRQRYPDLFAASLLNNLDFAPTGGETFRQTNRRMAAWAQDFRDAHLDSTVLVVGHGGTLRAAILGWLDLPDHTTFRFIMANCNLSIIDTYPDNAVLRLYNDTSHLEPLQAGA
jgi:broad specificity phosphatase PhoE